MAMEHVLRSVTCSIVLWPRGIFHGNRACFMVIENVLRFMDSVVWLMERAGRARGSAGGSPYGGWGPRAL